MRIGVSVILLLVLFVSGAWAEDHAVLEAALGLTRADRRLIQSSLATEGFDPGPVDGVFGRQTRAAIGQWQAARGEEPTGYLDAEAARLLLARPPQMPESVEAALALTREDRRLIQSALTAEGFAPGPVDGVFGRQTRAAIGQWQAARGEEPTGYLDAEAARLLLARPPQMPESVEAALALTREDRRLIQSALTAEGFAPGPADGVFGRRTRAAIGQWQAARGEEPTGYLDAEATKSLLALGTKPEREVAARDELEAQDPDRQTETESDRERQRQQREAEADRQRREGQPGTRIRDCEACPELVVVPAGSFMMGSPASEWGRFNNEGPQRRVTIAEPFAVGVYEVTFREWDACVSEGGCNGYRPDDLGWGRGGRPVINVSWGDARAYVKWLSQRTGKHYRLLSASEWEYVARAGTTGPFHTGSTISSDQANYDSSYTYASGQKGRYRGQTVQVGTFAPNAFGLHEVLGVDAGLLE